MPFDDLRHDILMLMHRFLEEDDCTVYWARTPKIEDVLAELREQGYANTYQFNDKFGGELTSRGYRYCEKYCDWRPK